MILSITTTHQPATDLGYLLHKHPDKFQTFDLSVGTAYVFYPEKSIEKTTLSLLLDLNALKLTQLARNQGIKESFSLAQYVNDRPYVASSFMSVALSKVFSSAMNGRCSERSELVQKKIPLMASIAVIAVPKGGEALLRSFFEPLGYAVDASAYPLESTLSEWGESHYFKLVLSNTLTVQALLSHLYVLIPALDANKHYFVNEHEIQKLLQKGEGWLDTHPEKEKIIKRYLKNLSALSKKALREISPTIENLGVEMEDDVSPKQERLHDIRLKTVGKALEESGAKSVLDLGCGEGKLMGILARIPQFTRIVGMDVSYKELLKAKERLHFDDLSTKNKERLGLFQGSLLYKDDRLTGFDAAAIVEVIEHLDIHRLKIFERVVFECAKPKTIVLTTPNKEYNTVWNTLDREEFRHEDHRFEWNRKEFMDWSQRIAQLYSYRVSFHPIGEEIENIGAPSQMAIFTYGN